MNTPRSILCQAFFCVAMLVAAQDGACAQLVAATPAPPVPLPPGYNQFGAFAAPPYEFDSQQGEVVNLETELVKPIAVTADGQRVIAVNEPDARIVFLNADLQFLGETALGQGIASVAIRPNASGPSTEVWVTLNHQSAVAVVDLNSFLVTHWLRPAIAPSAVGAGDAAFPAGIAFTGDGAKAYVAATFSDALIVYDAVQKTHLTTIPLEWLHNGVAARLNDPYAVIEHGGIIYVASRLSGNDTIAESEAGDLAALGATTGLLGPDDVFVKDLALDPNRSLPDFDVARIDPVSDSVLSMVRGLSTVIFGLAASSQSNRIIVTGFKSRNGEFIGEGSFTDGKVVRNELAHFRVNNPLLVGRLSTENLGPSSDNIVMPTDVAVDASGRIYFAGYASSNIGIFQPNGAYFGTISTDSGPRGLAVANSTQRLYSLNRAAGTVTCYDIASTSAPPSAALFQFAFFDPTFDGVKQGRQLFLTPKSGAMTTGCFSCHPDGRKDNLGWQLSKFLDVGEEFSLPAAQGGPPSGNGSPTEWRDLKGVMVTQDLRSLPEVPGYHWRGEQKDLEDFNGAFVGLLKSPTPMDASDFAFFKQYVFSTVYPANPFQPMNRVYTPGGLNGFAGFNSDDPGPTGDGRSCNSCHAMPTGTDSSITVTLLGVPSSRVVKSAQLRAAWTKSSDACNIDDLNPAAPFLWPLGGFGFAHEGLFDSVEQVNNFYFLGTSLGATGVIPDVTQFIAELDTGLAPATMYSAFANSGPSFAAARVRTYLVPQTVAGNCDIAVKGRMRVANVWRSIGLFSDRSLAPGVFLADDSTIGPFTWDQLRTLVTNGDAELVFLGVPRWSGERIGVDRDRDAVYDADELAQGLDPRNPDTDGDGMWDSYDPSPLNPAGMILPAGAPQVVAGSVEVLIANANAIKLVYETTSFSPTRVEFGETTAYGFFSGDALLPTGAGAQSNHWKRRHTVFIRPQPAQGLTALTQGTVYHFRIWTQGQNGQTAQSADMTQSTDVDQLSPGIRAEEILLSGVNNGDGTFTYTAFVELVDNALTPVGNGICVPGRITTYSGTTFTTQHFATLTQTVGAQTGVAVFSYTTSVGEQQVGDFTLFDSPMTLDVQNCDGTPSPTIFPGQWPEGVSAVTTTAPP